MVPYSIVIPSRNVTNLSSCVAAILRNEPSLPTERIFVVDDDETLRIARYAGDVGIASVRGEKPFIFARNANIGLNQAFAEGAETVILLNDDAMLSKRHGFTAMVEAQRCALEFGLVASSCNNVGNLNQHPKGSAFIRIEPRMLCFVCVAIPRSVYVEVGPLDEAFTGYGFDDDAYSVSVKRAGFKLGIFDGCYVDHGSLVSTFRGGPTAYPREAFEANQRIFIEKYGGHA